MKLHLPLPLLAVVIASTVVSPVSGDETIADGQTVVWDTGNTPDTSKGVVTINGNGTLTLSNATGVDKTDFYAGSLNMPANGTLTLNEGTSLFVSDTGKNSIILGADDGADLQAVVNVNGTLSSAGIMRVGFFAHSGKITVSSTGTLILKGINVDKGSAGRQSEVNLEGGRMYLGADGLKRGGGRQETIFNFKSGTIGALTDWTSGAAGNPEDNATTWTLDANGGSLTVDTLQKDAENILGNGKTITVESLVANAAGGTVSGKLIKQGYGKLILNNTNNTFAQVVRIEKGFVQVAGDGALGQAGKAVEMAATALENRDDNVVMGFIASGGTIATDFSIETDSNNKWVGLGGSSSSDAPSVFTGNFTSNSAQNAMSLAIASGNVSLSTNSMTNLTGLRIYDNARLTLTGGNGTRYEYTITEGGEQFVIGARDSSATITSRLTVGQDATLKAGNVVIYLSRWNNQGELYVSGNGILEAKGILGEGNGGNVVLAGGTLQLGTGGITQNAGSEVHSAWTFNSGKLKADDDTRVEFNGTFNDDADGTRVIDTNGHSIDIQGTISGEGSFAKQGEGMLKLSGNNENYSGDVTLKKGTLQAVQAKSFGTGVISVSGGTLDINSLALANNVSMTGGSLSNAEGFAGELRIKEVSENIQLGNVSGSTIKELSTSSETGKISGIDGNMALNGTTSLTIGTSQMTSAGTPGTAVVVEFNDASSSLTLGGNTSFELSSSLMDALFAGGNGDYQIALTNGLLNPGNLNSFSFNASGYGNLIDSNGNSIFSVTGSTGGNLNVTAKPADAVFYVASNQTINLDEGGANPYDSNIGKYSAVFNNGTLNLNLAGAPPADKPSGIILNNLTSSADAQNAVIQTTTGADGDQALVTLHNSQNTKYAGSILCEAQLVKTGSGNLGIDGNVQTSGLTVSGGDISIGKNLTSTGDVTVQTGASLTLKGSGSSADSLILEGTGSLTLGNNAVLNVSGLTSTGNTGSISLGAGSLLSVDASSILHTSVTGTGTLSITGAGHDFSLGEGGAMGNQIVLNVSDGASASLVDGNSVGAISGNGSIQVDGTVTLMDAGGTFSGALFGNGTLDHTGANTQTIDGQGAETVSIVQSGAGTITLSNTSGGDIRYDALEALNGTVHLANDATVNRVVIGSTGTVTLGSETTEVFLHSSETALSAGGRLIVDGMTANTSSQPVFSAGQVSFDGNGTFNFSIGTSGDWSDTEYGIALMSGTGINPDDYTALLRGSALNLGFTVSGFAYEDSVLKLLIRSSGKNGFLRFANSSNTTAAANSLWQARFESPDENGVLQNMINAIRDAGSGDPGALTDAQATQSLASYAGSSITSLLSSQKDDLRQQVKWIRNRTVYMGVDSRYRNEDAPYFNAWVQGNAAYNDLSQQGDQAGYSMTTWGGTVGCDMEFSNNLTLGAAFTANHNKLTTDSYDPAQGDNDANYFNVFGRYKHGNWAHTLIATAGWNDMTLNRTVRFGDQTYYTKGNTDGNSFGAFYEGTYDVKLNENETTVFQPLFNVSLYRSSLGDYTESGMGDASMRIHKETVTYGSAGLGARLMGVLGENIMGRPALGEIRLQVVQDYGDRTNGITINPLGAAGGAMRVKGAKVGTTGLQVGAGLALPVGEGGTIYADVDADWRSKATVVSGNIGYRYNF